MAYFELISADESGFTYYNYPENRRDKPGIIGIRNGERFIEKLSEDDQGGMYARQCFRHLHGQPKGMAAWF